MPACPRHSSTSARLAHLSKSDGRLVNVCLCLPSHSESAVVITESRWDHDLASHSAPSSGATKPSLSQGPSVLWGGKDSGTGSDVTVEWDHIPEWRVYRQGPSLTLRRCRGGYGGTRGCYPNPSCYFTCGHLGLVCPCSRPTSAYASSPNFTQYISPERLQTATYQYIAGSGNATGASQSTVNAEISHQSNAGGRNTELLERGDSLLL